MRIRKPINTPTGEQKKEHVPATNKNALQHLHTQLYLLSEKLLKAYS
jgi:hypothetical protein